MDLPETKNNEFFIALRQRLFLTLSRKNEIKMKFARQKRLLSLDRNELRSLFVYNRTAQFKLFSNRKLLSTQAVVLLINHISKVKDLF